MKIWKIEMEDLSHLSGPMGSGLGTPLGTELFKEEADALAFMKRKASHDTFSREVKTLTKLPTKAYYDCGNISFRVECVDLR